MSFNAHKRDALDVTLPINHRMSHLRSCAVLLGDKYRVPRSSIIERVLHLCGVDITVSAKEPEIQRAMQALVIIKESGLGDPAAPPAGYSATEFTPHVNNEKENGKSAGEVPRG